MRIAVVTKVPALDGPDAWENLAWCVPTHLALTPEKVVPFTCEDVGMDVGTALALRQPVFGLEEILILDMDGREVSGRGRKPGKWGVEIEEFDATYDGLIDARQKSLQILR